MDPGAQVRYQIYVTMLWISYFIAIRASPGHPPKNHKVASNQWKKWCKKCENYKPERAHHCKKCNSCVLQMDHHCPWTNNCVGHGNMPHFIRFLVWVMFTTGITLWELLKRAIGYYQERELPAYLIRRSEMAAVILFWPLDAFVLFSVLILFLRCMMHITLGKTQIEVWETERIEGQFYTERLWIQIRENYRKIHHKEMPKLTLWSQSAREYEMTADIIDDDIVPVNFQPDDLVFPYDLGFWENIRHAMGNVWTWPLPWGRPIGNGYEFIKNEDDDQLNLPWPPDGGNVDYVPRELSEEELRQLNDVSAIRRHLDPRSNMKRSQWMNDMGETLNDFGVDVDDEDEVELAT